MNSPNLNNCLQLTIEHFSELVASFRLQPNETSEVDLQELNLDSLQRVMSMDQLLSNWSTYLCTASHTSKIHNNQDSHNFLGIDVRKLPPFDSGLDIANINLAHFTKIIATAWQIDHANLDASLIPGYHVALAQFKAQQEATGQETPTNGASLVSNANSQPLPFDYLSSSIKSILTPNLVHYLQALEIPYQLEVTKGIALLYRLVHQLIQLLAYSQAQQYDYAIIANPSVSLTPYWSNQLEATLFWVEKVGQEFGLVSFGVQEELWQELNKAWGDHLEATSHNLYHIDPSLLEANKATLTDVKNQVTKLIPSFLQQDFLKERLNVGFQQQVIFSYNNRQDLERIDIFNPVKWEKWHSYLREQGAFAYQLFANQQVANVDASNFVRLAENLASFQNFSLALTTTPYRLTSQGYLLNLKVFAKKFKEILEKEEQRQIATLPSNLVARSQVATEATTEVTPETATETATEQTYASRDQVNSVSNNDAPAKVKEPQQAPSFDRQQTLEVNNKLTSFNKARQVINVRGNSDYIQRFTEEQLEQVNINKALKFARNYYESEGEIFNQEEFILTSRSIAQVFIDPDSLNYKQAQVAVIARALTNPINEFVLPRILHEHIFVVNRPLLTFAPKDSVTKVGKDAPANQDAITAAQQSNFDILQAYARRFAPQHAGITNLYQPQATNNQSSNDVDLNQVRDLASFHVPTAEEVSTKELLAQEQDADVNYQSVAYQQEFDVNHLTKQFTPQGLNSNYLNHHPEVAKKLHSQVPALSYLLYHRENSHKLGQIFARNPDISWQLEPIEDFSHYSLDDREKIYPDSYRQLNIQLAQFSHTAVQVFKRVLANQQLRDDDYVLISSSDQQVNPELWFNAGQLIAASNNSLIRKTPLIVANGYRRSELHSLAHASLISSWNNNRVNYPMLNPNDYLSMSHFYANPQYAYTSYYWTIFDSSKITPLEHTDDYPQAILELENKQRELGLPEPNKLVIHSLKHINQLTRQEKEQLQHYLLCQQKLGHEQPVIKLDQFIFIPDELWDQLVAQQQELLHTQQQLQEIALQQAELLKEQQASHKLDKTLTQLPSDASNIAIDTGDFSVIESQPLKVKVGTHDNDTNYTLSEVDSRNIDAEFDAGQEIADLVKQDQAPANSSSVAQITTELKLTDSNTIDANYTGGNFTKLGGDKAQTKNKGQINTKGLDHNSPRDSHLSNDAQNDLATIGQSPLGLLSTAHAMHAKVESLQLAVTDLAHQVANYIEFRQQRSFSLKSYINPYIIYEKKVDVTFDDQIALERNYARQIGMRVIKAGEPVYFVNPFLIDGLMVIIERNRFIQHLETNFTDIVEINYNQYALRNYLDYQKLYTYPVIYLQSVIRQNLANRRNRIFLNKFWTNLGQHLGLTLARYFGLEDVYVKDGNTPSDTNPNPNTSDLKDSFKTRKQKISFRKLLLSPQGQEFCQQLLVDQPDLPTVTLAQDLKQASYLSDVKIIEQWAQQLDTNLVEQWRLFQALFNQLLKRCTTSSAVFADFTGGAQLEQLLAQPLKDSSIKFRLEQAKEKERQGLLDEELALLAGKYPHLVSGKILKFTPPKQQFDLIKYRMYELPANSPTATSLGNLEVYAQELNVAESFGFKRVLASQMFVNDWSFTNSNQYSIIAGLSRFYLAFLLLPPVFDAEKIFHKQLKRLQQEAKRLNITINRDNEDYQYQLARHASLIHFTNRIHYSTGYSLPHVRARLLHDYLAQKLPALKHSATSLITNLAQHYQGYSHFRPDINLVSNLLVVAAKDSCNLQQFSTQLEHVPTTFIIQKGFLRETLALWQHKDFHLGKLYDMLDPNEGLALATKDFLTPIAGAKLSDFTTSNLSKQNQLQALSSLIIPVVNQQLLNFAQDLGKYRLGLLAPKLVARNLDANVSIKELQQTSRAIANTDYATPRYRHPGHSQQKTNFFELVPTWSRVIPTSWNNTSSSLAYRKLLSPTAILEQQEVTLGLNLYDYLQAQYVTQKATISQLPAQVDVALQDQRLSSMRAMAFGTQEKISLAQPSHDATTDLTYAQLSQVSITGQIDEELAQGNELKANTSLLRSLPSFLTPKAPKRYLHQQVMPSMTQLMVNLGLEQQAQELGQRFGKNLSKPATKLAPLTALLYSDSEQRRLLGRTTRRASQAPKVQALWSILERQINQAQHDSLTTIHNLGNSGSQTVSTDKQGRANQKRPLFAQALNSEAQVVADGSWTHDKLLLGTHDDQATDTLIGTRVEATSGSASKSGDKAVYKASFGTENSLINSNAKADSQASNALSAKSVVNAQELMASHQDVLPTQESQTTAGLQALKASGSQAATNKTPAIANAQANSAVTAKSLAQAAQGNDPLNKSFRAISLSGEELSVTLDNIKSQDYFTSHKIDHEKLALLDKFSFEDIQNGRHLSDAKFSQQDGTNTTNLDLTTKLDNKTDLVVPQDYELDKLVDDKGYINLDEAQELTRNMLAHNQNSYRDRLTLRDRTKATSQALNEVNPQQPRVARVQATPAQVPDNFTWKSQRNPAVDAPQELIHPATTPEQATNTKPAKRSWWSSLFGGKKKAAAQVVAAPLTTTTTSGDQARTAGQEVALDNQSAYDHVAQSRYASASPVDSSSPLGNKGSVQPTPSGLEQPKLLARASETSAQEVNSSNSSTAPLRTSTGQKQWLTGLNQQTLNNHADVNSDHGSAFAQTVVARNQQVGNALASEAVQTTGETSYENSYQNSLASLVYPNNAPTSRDNSRQEATAADKQSMPLLNPIANSLQGLVDMQELQKSTNSRLVLPAGSTEATATVLNTSGQGLASLSVLTSQAKFVTQDNLALHPKAQDESQVKSTQLHASQLLEKDTSLIADKGYQDQLGTKCLEILATSSLVRTYPSLVQRLDDAGLSFTNRNSPQTLAQLKVKVINLDSHFHRWEKQLATFKGSGILSIQRIDAVNGPTLSEQEISQYFDRVGFKNNYSRFPLVTEIGRVLSHRKALLNILHDPTIDENDYALICEDNLNFGVLWQRRLARILLQAQSTNYDWINLTHHNVDSQQLALSDLPNLNHNPSIFTNQGWSLVRDKSRNFITNGAIDLETKVSDLAQGMMTLVNAPYSSSTTTHAACYLVRKATIRRAFNEGHLNNISCHAGDHQKLLGLWSDRIALSLPTIANLDRTSKQHNKLNTLLLSGLYVYQFTTRNIRWRNN